MSEHLQTLSLQLAMLDRLIAAERQNAVRDMDFAAMVQKLGNLSGRADNLQIALEVEHARLKQANSRAVDLEQNAEAALPKLRELWEAADAIAKLRKARKPIPADKWAWLAKALAGASSHCDQIPF